MAYSCAISFFIASIVHTLILGQWMSLLVGEALIIKCVTDDKICIPDRKICVLDDKICIPDGKICIPNGQPH